MGSIVSWFASLPVRIGEAIGSIPSLIGQVFSGSFSFSGSGATASVPAFASGGIVNREMLARVGDGGESEAIAPLSDLRSMIAEAVNSGGSGGPNLQVGVLVADDRGLKELFRRLEQVRLTERVRIGVSPA